MPTNADIIPVMETPVAVLNVVLMVADVARIDKRKAVRENPVNLRSTLLIELSSSFFSCCALSLELSAS